MMSKPAYPRPVELRELETEPLSKSYPAEDTSYDAGIAPIQRTTWKTRFSGWRGGVLLAITMTSFVLLLNILLTIIAATVWKTEDGIATAFTGNCKEVARWTTALHLLINLLSSVLLGASNYCMQRLVAPTREEIDNAHARRNYLDIGMPSMRNLASIARSRVVLWLLLGMSSVPLHFVYNSVVFETLAANVVDLVYVTPEFFTDKNSWSSLDYNDTMQAWTVTMTWENDTYMSDLQALVLDDKYLDSSLFENITGPNCQKRYHASFVTDGGAGFAVVDTAGYSRNTSNSLLSNYTGLGDVGTNQFDDDILYCLSQNIDQKCQLQFSMSIFYVVIACNVSKVLLMVIVLWRRDQETLVTIGDAIKSFLRSPDPSTTDCCLMSRRDVDKLWKTPALRSNQRWQSQSKKHWGTACSRRRWVFSLLLYIAAIAVASALLVTISASKVQSPRDRNGFGRLSLDHLVDVTLPFPDSIVPLVLLGNLPQVVISFFYLTYNGLFTCMLAGREWANYAIKRAPLRVTIPSPGQRSTYFLQLPYAWSLPLLIASALLHWFISQSIFLVHVAIYRRGQPVPASDYIRFTVWYNHFMKAKFDSVFSALGYSDSALISAIVWGSALVVGAILAAAFCKYPKGLPVGGTNSAVISASCHLRYAGEDKHGLDEDVAERPLMWGVTIRGERDRIGHCSFSDREVEKPKQGALYAGLVKRKDN